MSKVIFGQLGRLKPEKIQETISACRQEAIKKK